MFVLLVMLLGMDLCVFLEVLGTLERLLANLACVRFEWCMDSQVTGNVITFCAGGAAILPFAGQAKVVGALPTNVIVAEMVVQRFRIAERESTLGPETVVDRSQIRIGSGLRNDRV